MGFVLISFWWDIVALITTLSVVFYYWILNKYDYWKKRGLPGPEPSLFTGNAKKLITGKVSFGELFTELYFQTKSSKCVGVYMLMRPTLLVNDLETIKTIMSKDFMHFSDHAFKTNTKTDPLSDHLFNAAGAKWKNMRAKMTPTFTTSKMKEMFDAVLGCSSEMIDYLEDGGDDQIFNAKELMAKLNTDVIGTCAFGVECNSFKHPDAKFRMMGKDFFTPSFRKTIVSFLMFFAPDFTYVSGIRTLGKEYNDFFYDTVKNVIEYREKNNVTRKDFIQVLMQMRAEDENSDIKGKHDYFKIIR